MTDNGGVGLKTCKAYHGLKTCKFFMYHWVIKRTPQTIKETLNMIIIMFTKKD